VVFPAGPDQRADAGAEAAGDPEPAPAAAADAAAAAAAGAAADTDDARAGLEHDPQHGGRRWHTSNHEQSADPAGKCAAVPVSSELRYWFHPPVHFSSPYSPVCVPQCWVQAPLLQPLAWLPGNDGKHGASGFLGVLKCSLVPSTSLALVPRVLQAPLFF